jgi:hypothetical protein
MLFEAPVDNEAVEPIKRLMLAMLNHAVRSYQMGLHEQKTSELEAFLEAEEWLFGTQSSDPSSFEDFCSAVNIDAGPVRDMQAGGTREACEEVHTALAGAPSSAPQVDPLPALTQQARVLKAKRSIMRLARKCGVERVHDQEAQESLHCALGGLGS